MNLVSLRFISRNPLSRDQRPLSRKYRVTGPDFSQNPPPPLSLSRSTHVSILFLLLLLLFVSKQRRRLTSPQSVDATCQFRANRMLIERVRDNFRPISRIYPMNHNDYALTPRPPPIFPPRISISLDSTFDKLVPFASMSIYSKFTPTRVYLFFLFKERKREGKLSRKSVD